MHEVLTFQARKYWARRSRMAPTGATQRKATVTSTRSHKVSLVLMAAVELSYQANARSTTRGWRPLTTGRDQAHHPSGPATQPPAPRRGTN